MKKRATILSMIVTALMTISSFAYTRVNCPKWIQDTNGWRLIDTETNMMVYSDFAYVGDDTYIFQNGYMLHDQWITMYDKYQYYCGSDGKVLKNAVTPDGYSVNAEGRYIDNGMPIQDSNYTVKELNFRVNASDYVVSTQEAVTQESSVQNNNASSLPVPSGIQKDESVFWGGDNLLTYYTIMSLYRNLKDPMSLKIKGAECITYTESNLPKDDLTCRACVIIYYAANSFGALNKDEYVFVLKSDGSGAVGNYYSTVPKKVINGWYKDAHVMENTKDILAVVEQNYWN